jgi:methylthioribulose-1-phosphate dehydratase
MTYPAVAQDLVFTGREFHRRGWVLGTSGNFSVVLAREPLRIAITESSADKGALELEQILQIDEQASVVESIRHSNARHNSAKPSAETLLHLAVIKASGAGAVLHTHSVWSTLLSDRAFPDGRLTIHGYEMLKGLAGVTTHEHEERIPIFENTQDMETLSDVVERMLEQHPEAHAFLIRRHGLYTWGKDLKEAVRHVEILEFLMEVLWRSFEFQKPTVRSEIMAK